ncbi:M4 family metallopeptidase [Streptomyces syringium]|uniref:M4 family metallopeptidase n=1 Tax=Streptomyces syringium TaxID=76729 RepID=UPI00367E8E37
MAFSRSPRRTLAAGLFAATVVFASCLQTGPAGARPTGDAAVGFGCATGAGGVKLDTTYNPDTKRYELGDPKRGNHKTYDMNGSTTGTGTPVTDDDNIWCDNDPHGRQADAVAAHYIHSVFWDYFLDAHGRKGMRNDGRAGCSRVRYGNESAFYNLATSCMTYGTASSPSRNLIRIDVGAHEMTHGVIAATAGLGYFGETAGLGEAISDIFAVAAEFHAGNRADPGDYLIGEGIDISGDRIPLRYLDKPSRDGASKDYWYSGISRIHPQYASGPANHFFYLLAEGSGQKVINGVSYNSPTYDGRPVTGLGRSAAEKILYKALTERMTSNTDYHGARQATLAAAADLHGRDSDRYRAVEAAWTAVNVK